MTQNNDIRWIQRLYNYQRALAQLNRFIKQKQLNELEQQGLIQAFEYTHELAWNVLKDTATRIVDNIQNKFFGCFCHLSEVMQQLEKDYE